MTERTALVTGGTRGIGAAICKTLHASGYKVAANYASNDEKAKKFQEETGIPVYKWNVASADECLEGVEKVANDIGSIEVLVNNAGIIRDSMMHKMSIEDWSSVISTNLTSCFNMCRTVITDMRDKNFGRIINISSINAQAGQLGQTNYSAAKAGILGFTKALSRENSAKGITVNAVAPGYTKTDMTGGVNEEVMKKIVSQIPIGRLGEPEEVARCVLFLAADDAGFLTGETLSINGGQYME